MEAAVIDEFSRIGGGQVLSNILIDYLNKNNYNTYVEVDYSHNYLNYNKNKIIETPYKFYENMNIIKLYYYVKKTEKFLSNYNKKNNFDFIFNNHPNMFLHKSNINAMHGFSFLDPIIDEYGNIMNKKFFYFIKQTKLYKIYNNANFYYNSKYTCNLSKKLFPFLNIKPNREKIIYIPVENHIDSNLSMKNKKLIISIGRINIGKRYCDLLNVAKKMPGYHFIIAGALNKGDEKYYEKLINLKTQNVEIKINISNTEKIDLLKKASIYMHFNRKENYGISVIEAISYGLIPIIPKSGGPWIDIIEEGKYGYGYESLDDIPELVKGIDYSKSKEIIDSVNRFSYENFYNNLNDFIEETK